MPKKILIIDDDPTGVQLLSTALAEKYHVIVAEYGKEGFEKAKKEIPDLILLDIKLPDIDGVDVLQLLKKDHQTSGIPVIVLTNMSDEATVSRILQAGGTNYLVKTDWSITDIAQKIAENV